MKDPAFDITNKPNSDNHLENMPLYERAHLQIPHWANDRILPWDPKFDQAKKFAVEAYWNHQASLNVFLVVGTQHPDYIGLTWLEFLERGKRMQANLYLHGQNPGYYRELAPRNPSMLYESFDGKRFYVAGDGNHRTCIARFDFFYSGVSMLHGLHIWDYKIDWELMDLFNQIGDVAQERRIPIAPASHKKPVKREDTAGWMLETYETKIQIRENSQDVLLDTNEARTFLAKIKGSGFRKWFGF